MTQISAEEGPNSVSVKNLSSCEGDVDVSQRKGKIITLFDVKLVLDIEGCDPSTDHKVNYSGATKEDEKVTGTITIPEVAHDTEEDEYVVSSNVPRTSADHSLMWIFSQRHPRKAHFVH